MTAKEFLLNDLRLNNSEIAKLMYPNNLGAKAYLNKKLKGVRPWLDSDEKKALEVLHQLKLSIPSKD